MPQSPAARTGYTLGSPTRACAATGRALATGEPYIAALVQVVGGAGDAEEFRRIDFSLDAWKSGARPRDGDGGRLLPVLGFWRGSVPEPGAKRRMLIDDESLLDLFEQSGEDGPGDGTPAAPDDRRAFRFILALILLRKKLLVCERTEKNGTMLVRPRGSPKSSEGGVLSPVEDPGLNDASTARIADQLSALLDGEPAGAPPSTATAPAGGGAGS